MLYAYLLSYSFLTKSAKLKQFDGSYIVPYCYSFLTKSAKLKQEANKGIDETSYSFLTKSAKLKQLKKGARIK